MEQEKVKCTYGLCNNNGLHAIYQLRYELTKVWRTDICLTHILKIEKENKKELCNSGREYQEYVEVEYA